MNSYFKLIYLLDKLKGKKIQYIGRCLDLVWIGFGDIIERKTKQGVDKIAEYSLHIQCPFKIVDKCKIVVGKSDMFVSATDKEDTVDLNLQNNTLFDLKAKTLMDSFNTEKIIDVELNEWGDLFIYLDSINIAIFIDNSTDDESWRLFRTGSDDEHAVVSGTGIEFC